MNGLREKFQNKKGFTLIEMLIVVAIIAILIAISIPLINGALERARDSTDQANERAAKAEALIIYMGVSADASDKAIETEFYKADGGQASNIWYDAVAGKLVQATGANTNWPTANDAYGKCTKIHTDVRFAADGGQDTGNHTNKVLKVYIADGEVTLKWVNFATLS